MFLKENDKITAVLSANAGISITTPYARIWVDALHDEHEETFSDVTPAMWEEMKKHPDFRDPDVLVFTHKHGDHYSAGLLAEAMRLYPAAKVILPTGTSVQAAMHSQEDRVREYSLCPDVPDGDMLYTIRTLHEGKAFTDVPHDAILIVSCGKKILLTGDMRIDRENAERLVEDARETADVQETGEYLFDAVFAAFPWETTTKGRTILQEVLKPGQTILYHIPFGEDDLYGYRKGVEKALQREAAKSCLSALMEPFEQIVLSE